MTITYYPASLYPADESGFWAIAIAGINVNAQGETSQLALENATRSLQEIVDMLRKEGTEIPQPTDVDNLEVFEGGSVALIPVALPERPVRVNVNLPDDLLQRIDSHSTNRSAFLAEAALEKLTRE